MFDVASVYFKQIIRHVFSLKNNFLVQKFQVYFSICWQQFFFSKSVHSMYQLMWCTPCSLSVSINKNLTDLNAVAEVAMQLDRHILSPIHFSWKSLIEFI